MVRFFILDRWNISDRFQKATMVEPPHPLEGCEFDILEGPPWPPFSNGLRLEKPDDGLGQGVIVGITLTADRRIDARIV
jgi:hypothetical protein